MAGTKINRNVRQLSNGGLTCKFTLVCHLRQRWRVLGVFVALFETILLMIHKETEILCLCFQTSQWFLGGLVTRFDFISLVFSLPLHFCHI